MPGKGLTVKKDWDNPVEHAMPAEARVPAEVRLGSVVVRPATVLAPMAGVTDTVFRRFIRHASVFSRDQVSGVRDQLMLWVNRLCAEKILRLARVGRVK